MLTTTMLYSVMLIRYYSVFFWETIPVLLLVGISLGLSLVLLIVSWAGSTVTVSRDANLHRFTAYECGFDAFDDARMKFDVRYYLVAILFLLFDVELVYLIPFSILLPCVSTEGFWTVELFMVFISFGFVFEYSKGALSWQSI